MPELKSMQRAVQEAFLPGVHAGVKAALPAIGVVRKGLVGTAGVLGSAAQQFGQQLGSASGQADLSGLMANNTKAIGLFADAGLHVADVMRNLLVASEPLVIKIAQLADHLAKVMDAASKSGRASGSLAAFFDRAYNSAVLLGHILVNIGKGIAHIFHAGAPAGTSLLTSLEKATKTFADWTGSAGGQAKMAQFFQNTVPLAKQVGDTLVRVVKLIATLADRMGGGNYNILFSALNDLLTVLTALAKVPGLGPILTWALAFGAARPGSARSRPTSATSSTASRRWGKSRACPNCST